ncbi:patatin-like phospholipase family protein [Schlesneria paludicola]|uniref:patatin-like phospholipase family protein n=1 Tax=Schlesneria paludicola TaxID=360056 RepID=UPI00029AD973|nr:patatin-like phospholipase family protein [Schlesneria paludicola]
MLSKCIRRGFVPLWIALIAGCATFREFPPLTLNPAVRLIDRDAQTTPEDSEIQQSSASDDGFSRTKQILVLSGGGLNGAFVAGVLNGWSESGNRPRYDMVTGVSTGALIAPFAFLGSDYDGDLKRLYASQRGMKIYRPYSLLALPWSNAFADSEPLRQRIATEVTADMLQKIAHEHRQGRRLYVGTTNLDSQQFVVWDLGAIAAGNDPNKLPLFRNILLASCSVPGLLPPIQINIDVDGKRYTELHADGGVSNSLFLLPQMLGLGDGRSTDPAEKPSTVYVIVAGKLAPDRRPVDGGILRVSDASLRGLMQAQMESDLKRAYVLAQRTGADFRLSAVPQHATINLDSMNGSAQTMRDLFELGRTMGESETLWRHEPPGIAPAEWPVPRSGVRFSQTDDRDVRS